MKMSVLLFFPLYSSKLKHNYISIYRINLKMGTILLSVRVKINAKVILIYIYNTIVTCYLYIGYESVFIIIIILFSNTGCPLLDNQHQPSRWVLRSSFHGMSSVGSAPLSNGEISISFTAVILLLPVRGVYFRISAQTETNST